MSRRKSSKELRNMLIALIIMIVLILIAFMIFIFNVDVKKNGSTNIRNIISNKDSKENEDVVLDGVIAPDELAGAEYESVDYDEDRAFEIKTKNGKVYLNVLDEDGFKNKYPNSKLDFQEEKEIATHDYKIKEVYIKKCKNIEYLLVTMEDGSIGIMNIDEAVKENVFRIKNELITLNKPVSRICTSYRVYDNKTEETTILVSSNGQMYDLQKFVE